MPAARVFGDMDAGIQMAIFLNRVGLYVSPTDNAVRRMNSFMDQLICYFMSTTVLYGIIETEACILCMDILYSSD